MYHLTDYYDLTQKGVTGDVAFYLEQAQQAKGDILDLACGTGRITIPLAEAGLAATGLELSAEMLQKAKDKAAAANVSELVTFVQGDMRNFDLGRPFALVMIPFRSFLHLLHIHEQIKALTAIRKHLAPGGKLLMNVFVPKIADLHQEAEKLSLQGVYPLANGEQVMMWDYTRYDHFQQLCEVTRTFERTEASGTVIERVVGRFTLRYIFPAELHHLLRLNGFKVVQRYGSFAKTPFDQHSTELIIVAEAV